jgi:hypothetical protein
MKMKGGSGGGGGGDGSDPSWRNFEFDRKDEARRFSSDFAAAATYLMPVINPAPPPPDTGTADTPTVPPRKPPAGGMKNK